MTSGRAVVVGGSVAATTAARALRLGGWDGEVVLLSDERHPAYARPPLSKGVLTGHDTPSSAHLPALDGVDIRAGAPATSLDVAAQRVTAGDGTTLGFDALVVATGGRARAIPGSKGPGVFTLRSLDDAVALRDALRGATSALVIGGGPLGMEVASASVSLGCRTTVVCRDQPMLRQLGPHIAGVLTSAARRAGVTIAIEPAGAAIIDGGGPRVRTAGGRTMAADVIVVAVGCEPNVEWLAGSGLTVDAGLVVDQTLHAAANIVAAGDVVAFPSGTRAERSPFWTNASEQAMIAAHNLLHSGDQRLYLARPHFWTNQFGMKVKICGPAEALQANPETIEGNPDTGAQVLRWRAGDLTAVGTINHPMPLPRLRKLLAQG